MRWRLFRHNAHGTAVLRPFDGELNFAFHQCEQGVVTTHAHVHTWVKFGTALTHDDVARNNDLTAKLFDAKAFTF